MSPAIFYGAYAAIMLGNALTAKKASASAIAERERAYEEDARKHAMSVQTQHEIAAAQIQASREAQHASPWITLSANAWPLLQTPAEVRDAVSRLRTTFGAMPLLVFYAHPPGANGLLPDSAALAALREFAQRDFGGALGGVAVRDAWRADRGIDDPAVDALRRELPNVPFLVLGLRPAGGDDLELLASYHPGLNAPSVEIRSMGNGPVSISALVADEARAEGDLWREKGIAALRTRGYNEEQIAAALGAGVLQEMQIADMERALSAEGVSPSLLAGRYNTARAVGAATPALATVLRLALAFFADGHMLLRHGIPPRGMEFAAERMRSAPPALEATARSVLLGYGALFDTAEFASAEKAAEGRLRFAAVLARAGLREEAVRAVSEATAGWARMRGLPAELNADPGRFLLAHLDAYDDARVAELGYLALVALRDPVAPELARRADELRRS